MRRRPRPTRHQNKAHGAPQARARQQRCGVVRGPVTMPIVRRTHRHLVAEHRGQVVLSQRDDQRHVAYGRRRDCHFDDTPLLIPIETPAEGRGGFQQHDSLADGYCRRPGRCSPQAQSPPPCPPPPPHPAALRGGQPTNTRTAVSQRGHSRRPQRGMWGCRAGRTEMAGAEDVGQRCAGPLLQVPHPEAIRAI